MSPSNALSSYTFQKGQLDSALSTVVDSSLGIYGDLQIHPAKSSSWFTHRQGIYFNQEGALYDRAISIKDSKDLIRIISLSKKFTFETWIQFSSLEQNAMIFGIGNFTAGAVMTSCSETPSTNFLMTQYGSEIQISVVGSVSGKRNCYEFVIPASECISAACHIVIQTTSNGIMAYVNKVLMSYISFTPNFLFWNVASKFYIAQQAISTNGLTWKGSVFSISICNSTLTANDIISIYSIGLPNSFPLVSSSSAAPYICSIYNRCIINTLYNTFDFDLQNVLVYLVKLTNIGSLLMSETNQNNWILIQNSSLPLLLSQSVSLSYISPQFEHGLNLTSFEIQVF